MKYEILDRRHEGFKHKAEDIKPILYGPGYITGIKTSHLMSYSSYLK